MQVTNAIPQLEFALELRVNVGPALELGVGLSGIRRTVPITGGTFSGQLISGRVLPGGADWQFIETDGLIHVKAQYVIETNEGVRVEVHNRGLRHGPPEVLARMAAGESVPSQDYYFRTNPRFYPPDGQHDWLKRSVFVGNCERHPSLILVHVWKVL
jgi:hypothetical protein